MLQLYPSKPPDSLHVADLSVEVGHLYLDDLADDATLREHFRPMAPYVAAAVECVPGVTSCSTAFMFDDHNLRPGTEYTPENVIPRVLQAAEDSKIEIDYIAREGACAGLAKIALAARGDRIALSTSGRSAVAMTRNEDGVPGPNDMIPSPKNSSAFMAVEAYHKSRRAKERRWSCAMLAAMWQISRLVDIPEINLGDPYPLDMQMLSGVAWSELPPLLQVNPDAAPFVAERSRSIIPSSFLPTEHAVDLIIQELFEEVPGEITRHISRSFL